MNVQAQHLSTLKALMEEKEYAKILNFTDSIFVSNSDIINKAEMLELRADSYYYLNRIEESLEEYLKTLQVAQNSEIDYQSLIQSTLSHIGFCYRQLGLFDKALPHYTESLKIAIDMKDSVETAIQSYNLGTVYFKLGKLNQSISQLNQAYAIDLARKDTSALGFDLSLMADLEVQIGSFDKALAYSKESLKWIRAIGSNANTKGIRMSKIGHIFFLRNELDSAAHYINAAKKILEDIGDSTSLSSIWKKLADISLKRKNYNKAIFWAKKIKNQHLYDDENSKTSYANLTLIKAYYENSDFDKAESIIAENIKLSQSLGLINDLKQTYFLESEVLKKQALHKKSRLAFDKYLIIKDSLISIDEKQQLRKLELTFKFDKIEHENEILKLNNQLAQTQIANDQQQIKWLMISLLVFVLAALVTVLALYSRFKLKKQLLTAEVNELRTHIKSILEGDTSGLELESNVLNEKLTEPLSDREFEILEYAISDLNNSQIADKIFVSVNTVKFHLKNIYAKLGVSNRKQALEYVIKSK